MNGYVRNIWLCVIMIKIKCDHIFQPSISIAIKRLTCIRTSHIHSSDPMATSSDFKPMTHPRECLICLCDLQDRVAQLACGHVFYCNCLSLWTESNKSVNSKTIALATTASYNNIYCSNIFSCPNGNRDTVVQNVYEKYVNFDASINTEEKPADVELVLIKKKKEQKAS